MTKVSDLFDVVSGHAMELNRHVRVSRDEGIAFVSRKMGDNGISAYIAPIPNVEPAGPGELSCALSGNGVLSTFLQEKPFYTGHHVARLIPKAPMCAEQLLYYCMCIKANRYRYSYGRQANRTLRDISIPASNEVPTYVSHANLERFDGYGNPASIEAIPALRVSRWKPFLLQELFDLKKGARLTKAALKPGKLAFISAIDSNNGLRQRISAPALHPAGVLTVNYNGNGVAEAFFQPEAFWASDDVNVLYPRFQGMDIYIALFICTVIRLEKYRFSYGRKWNLERMKISPIRLPVDDNGAPDWSLMRSYILTMPFSSGVADGKVSKKSRAQRAL
jgi:hypothetical protein